MNRKKPPSRLPGRKSARKAARKPRSIGTTVTFLEMAAQPLHHHAPPANIKLALARAEDMPVHYYRYLYDAVGRDYHWIDRRTMSDDALAAAIAKPGVEIFVAYAGGCPAGFFEIDASDPEAAWVAYFGLVPDYQGRGLGKWLLGEALAAAWSKNPGCVRVETCTLDDPRALPLYQKMGFVPYKRVEKTMPVME